MASKTVKASKGIAKLMRDDVRKKVHAMSVLGMGALAPLGSQKNVTRDIMASIAKTASYHEPVYKTIKHIRAQDGMKKLVEEWVTRPTPPGVRKETMLPSEVSGNKLLRDATVVHPRG